MQYATDSKDVDFHLSEDGVRSVFPNFVACYSPLYQLHSELLSPKQSNFLLQLGIPCVEYESVVFLDFWKKF